MDQYHYLFKFIIVGDANVGKSCISLRYTEKQFRSELDSTIGVEFNSQVFVKNEKTIKIQIWDTAGQEQFQSLIKQYFKGSIGALLVFDITNQQSFHNLIHCSKLLNSISREQSRFGRTVYIYIYNCRKISTFQAQAFADQYKMQYFETSAKTNYNIDQLFENTAMEIVDKIEKKQIEFTEDSGIKLGNYHKQQNTKKQDDDCKC